MVITCKFWSLYITRSIQKDKENLKSPLHTGQITGRRRGGIKFRNNQFNCVEDFVTKIGVRESTL